MRPLLPASLTVTWRDQKTVQVGLDPAHAVTVRDIEAGFVDWLRSLDGTRSESEVADAAAAHDLDEPTAVAVLRHLVDAGLVVDGTGRSSWPTGLAVGTRERLVPLVEGLALAGHDPGELLRRRRARCVVVHGAGRLGVPIASLLAAAGIGRVHVATRGVVTPTDVAPAGIGAGDVSRPRSLAASDAIHRYSPETDTRPPPPQHPPDLVVLTDTAALDPAASAPLQERAIAHLPCWIRETTGLIGPLVQPGATSCLRCVDLHRTDRDPAWPAVATQLAAMPRLPGGDPGLAATVAGLTAMAALTHLDGATPDVVGGSLQIEPGDGPHRRRSWPVHPRCGCTAPAWSAVG